MTDTDHQKQSVKGKLTKLRNEREEKDNIISYLKDTIQNKQDRIDWKHLFDKGYWVNAGNQIGG